MDIHAYFDAKSIKGQYQTAVAKETAKVMISFCEQEQEFRQAVEQSDITFQQALDKAVKGLGRSVSDEKFYNIIVQEYFPGAKVMFRPCIDLIGNGDKPDSAVSHSFDDLLNF